MSKHRGSVSGLQFLINSVFFTFNLIYFDLYSSVIYAKKWARRKNLEIFNLFLRWVRCIKTLVSSWKKTKKTKILSILDAKIDSGNNINK